MVVCLSPYKSPEHPLGLRKGGLDTRLFTSTPCNGTSQGFIFSTAKDFIFSTEGFIFSSNPVNGCTE